MEKKVIKLTKKEYKKLIKSVVEKTAQDIISMIGESTTIIYQNKPMEVIKSSTVVTNRPSKPVDKKEELLESLEFLRKKQYKTKQDKESIEIINSILKNMK